jgi:catechol 2,3-dioxygenase-like lactoylglutathione lyase family enzyme
VTRFKGMRHIALRVRDVERSAHFYEQVFRMRRFGPPKHGGRVIALASPGLKDQITLSTAADSARQRGISANRESTEGSITSVSSSPQAVPSTPSARASKLPAAASWADTMSTGVCPATSLPTPTAMSSK